MGVIQLDDETFRLAEKLAGVSGTTVAEIVKSALEAKAAVAGVSASDAPELTVEETIARIREITAHFRSLPVYDDRSPDEILGYNERGVWD